MSDNLIDDNYKSHLEAGLDYAHGDIYDKAIEHLSLAIEQGLNSDDEEEARRWRTICYGQSGHVEEALIDADWLIDKGHVDEYRWRAHLRDRSKDYAGAIEDYTRVIEHDSERSEPYYSRGMSNFFAKRYLDAVDDFTMALSLYTIHTPILDWAAFEWRGNSYVELGRYQDGLDDFQRATDIVKTEPHLHVFGFYFYRGLAREHLGDHDGAMEDYRRARIDSNHPEAARIMKMIEQTE